MLNCSRSGNSTFVYIASILFNLWAAPWAEAASVGKKSVQSGQSERYIHFNLFYCEDIPPHKHIRRYNESVAISFSKNIITVIVYKLGTFIIIIMIIVIPRIICICCFGYIIIC